MVSDCRTDRSTKAGFLPQVFVTIITVRSNKKAGGSQPTGSANEATSIQRLVYVEVRQPKCGVLWYSWHGFRLSAADFWSHSHPVVKTDQASGPPCVLIILICLFLDRRQGMSCEIGATRE